MSHEWCIHVCLPAWPLVGPDSPVFLWRHCEPLSIVVQRGGTEAVSPCQSGGWRLCCYVTPRSISICTLTVCLAPTAGLYKLITVNCVPPLHNQLMWLRPVRCAPEGGVCQCVSVCVCVCVCVCLCLCVCVPECPLCSMFNMSLNGSGLKSILIFIVTDPELIIKVNRVSLRVIQKEIRWCIYDRRVEGGKGWRAHWIT